MVEGLGLRASFQGFDTYEDASTDYFEARAKGWVRVLRLPFDNVRVLVPLKLLKMCNSLRIRIFNHSFFSFIV
jgi:hypothetical protein